MSIDRRERREKVSESKRCCSLPAVARGNYKIAKINHKTSAGMPRATIKLVGSLANRCIFFAFTTNHTAPENASYTSSSAVFFCFAGENVALLCNEYECFWRKKIARRFCNFCEIIVPVPTIFSFLSVFPPDVSLSRRIRNPLGVFKISSSFIIAALSSL